MSTKRIRVFAGPNGSGKTTIIKSLQREINYGVYVNADDIEFLLKGTNTLPFSNFNLNITTPIIQAFFKESSFSPIKRNEPDLWSKLNVNENLLHINTIIESYLAADIADFIRQQLLESNISFTYETVMSHPSKVDFLQRAREKGYRVYLYYIATEAPEINISRVNVRVAQNGHPVAPETVKNRYYKSLQQLKPAIEKTNRAYFWDNSGTTSLLIAEITNGTDVSIIDINDVPNWFVKYVVER